MSRAPKQGGARCRPRLLRGFKNLSQIFAAYDTDEEEERAMVIGLPTDVKHVVILCPRAAGASSPAAALHAPVRARHGRRTPASTQLATARVGTTCALRPRAQAAVALN
jgi:hypothetical protein